MGNEDEDGDGDDGMRMVGWMGIDANLLIRMGNM